MKYVLMALLFLPQFVLSEEGADIHLVCKEESVDGSSFIMTLMKSHNTFDRHHVEGVRYSDCSSGSCKKRNWYIGAVTGAFGRLLCRYRIQPDLPCTIVPNERPNFPVFLKRVAAQLTDLSRAA